MKPHVAVIDPARKTAEVECLNRMALAAPLPLTYHLPAMYGMQSRAAEDRAQVRGVVILGSASSVNDREPWQVALETWLKPHLLRGLPALGICYGHQMLAYMFGGRVDYLYPDRTKLKGLRRVEIGDLPRVSAGDVGWAKQSGALVVSHNEVVATVPADFAVIAHSDAVAVDGLAHRRLPIWSLQPHPEATTEFLMNHQIEGPIKDPPESDALRFGHGLVDAFIRVAANIARTP